MAEFIGEMFDLADVQELNEEERRVLLEEAGIDLVEFQQINLDNLE